MSMEAIAAAIRWPTASPTEKLILILLADRHNTDTNECSVSIKALAHEAEMKPENVLESLRKLRDWQTISVVERYDEQGRRVANNYDLKFMGRPPAKTGKMSKPSRRSLPVIPDLDWRPSDHALQETRRRHPDASDASIERTIRSFIDWTQANQRAYRDLDAAWRNSALRDLATEAAAARRSPASRSPRAGVAGAIAALVRDDRGDSR